VTSSTSLKRRRPRRVTSLHLRLSQSFRASWTAWATKRAIRQVAKTEIRLTLLLMEADQQALLLKEHRQVLSLLQHRQTETLDSSRWRISEVLGSPETPPSSTTTG
jgi:hypothetical protein